MRNQQHDSSHHYQTGPTTPPKSHGGIIAILLIAVIFLCGLVSILSVMNIRLFQMVQTQQQPGVSLQMRTSSAEAANTPRMAAAGQGQPSLGITGKEVTPFYQQYYQIPKGIYITDVAVESDCYSKGLRSGDILLEFNGTVITSMDTLKQLLETSTPGSQVCLRFYREGTEHTLTVLIGQKGE